jgi:hypothetical protein
MWPAPVPTHHLVVPHFEPDGHYGYAPTVISTAVATLAKRRRASKPKVSASSHRPNAYGLI